MGDKEEDEDEDLVLSPEEQIEKLKKRIEEIKSTIKAVEFNLREGGYIIQAVGELEKKDVAPKSGIRIKNELSVRGEMMSREMFDRFDEDDDGLLSLKDFRAMLACTHGYTRFIDELEYSNIESWKMFMSDNDYRVDKRGMFNVDTFVKYRKNIELKKPLAKELDTLGLGYLPERLRLWALVKTLIHERLSVRDPENPRQRNDGRLDLEDMSYILCCAGLCYTKGEIVDQMIVRARYEKTYQELVLNGYRRGYVEDPHRYASILLEGRSALKITPITKDFIYSCTPSFFTAWIFSNHVEPRYSKFYRFFLQSKYTTHRLLRRMTIQCGLMYDVGLCLKERMVFKDFTLLGQPINVKGDNQKSAFEFGVRVGDEQDDSEGTLVSWKLVRVEWPEGFCKRQKIPRDTGFYLAVDFLLRDDAEQEDVDAAAHSIKVLLMKHLDSALKENAFYKSLQVFSNTNDIDGAKVIRVIFLYNRNVSLDGYLERIGLPYTLADLLDVNGELKLNVHLLDVTSSSKNVNLDLQFAGRIDCVITYKLNVLMRILRRAAIALSSGPSESSIDTKEGEAYVDKWLHIRPLFSSIIKNLKDIIKFLSGTKSRSMMFKYASVSEMLRKFGSASLWMRKFFPFAIGTEAGFVGAKLKEYSKTFTNEVMNIFDIVKDYLNEKILREKDKRTMKFIKLSAKEPQSEEEIQRQNAADIKLKNLGLADMDADDVLEEAMLEEGDKKPEDFLEAEMDMQISYDGRALECYERFQKVVLGLHSVDTYFGKSRFYIVGQGLDFMEIVPKPPSYAQLDAEIQKKDAKLKAKR